MDEGTGVCKGVMYAKSSHFLSRKHDRCLGFILSNDYASMWYTYPSSQAEASCLTRITIIIAISSSLTLYGVLPNTLPSRKESDKHHRHDWGHRFTKTQKPPHNSAMPTAAVMVFFAAPDFAAPDFAAEGDGPPSVIVDVIVTTPSPFPPKEVLGDCTPKVKGTLFVVVAPSQATGSVLAVGIGVAVELFGFRTLKIIHVVSHSTLG